MNKFLLVVSALLCLIAGKAQAQPTTEPTSYVGQGVMCNAPAELERYIVLFPSTKNVEQTVEAVNKESEDKNACGMVTLRFIPQEMVKTVKSWDGDVDIIKIQLVAVLIPPGLWMMVPPTTQYIMTPAKKKPGHDI